MDQISDRGVEAQSVVVIGALLRRLGGLARQHNSVSAAAFDRDGRRLDDQSGYALQETGDTVKARVGPLDVLLWRSDEHLVDAAGVCALLGDQLIPRDAAAGRLRHHLTQALDHALVEQPHERLRWLRPGPRLAAPPCR